MASDPLVGDEQVSGVVTLAEHGLVGDDVVDPDVAGAAEVEAAVVQLVLGVTPLEAGLAVVLAGDEVVEGEGLVAAAKLAGGEAAAVGVDPDGRRDLPCHHEAFSSGQPSPK